MSAMKACNDVVRRMKAAGIEARRLKPFGTSNPFSDEQHLQVEVRSTDVARVSAALPGSTTTPTELWDRVPNESFEYKDVKVPATELKWPFNDVTVRAYIRPDCHVIVIDCYGKKKAKPSTLPYYD